MIVDLKGKTALVCGSTQGIGKAIAMQMAESGAQIILLARNEAKLIDSLAELNTNNGQKHKYIVADVSNLSQLESALNQSNDLNQIDILVNNTGGPPGGPIQLSAISEFEQAFKQHLLANHIITQCVIGGMKERKFGRIINIISTSVKIPLKGLGVSNTIRGAVANWSKTMANELASYGITVNNILPGATQTERLKTIVENKSAKQQVEHAEIEKEMLAEIPAGRFGKPEEPAYAATFLASDLASYITGTNVVVDGGRTGNL